MKKFKFRLQRVLDFRNSEKRDKQRELGLRNKELGDAEEYYNQLLTSHDSPNNTQRELDNMSDLQVAGDYRQRLSKSVKDQEQKVLEASELVECARESYLRSAVDASALNQVKRTRKEEWLFERKKAERKFGNEIAIQRYIRRKKY